MLQVQETFKKEVKSLKDYLLLVTVSAKSYQSTVTDLLRFLVNEQNVPGVYVTLNKPYEIVQRNLVNNSIDPRLIIFIDAASRTEQTKKIVPSQKLKSTNNGARSLII